MRLLTDFVNGARQPNRAALLAASIAATLCCLSPADAQSVTSLYSAEDALARLIPYLSEHGFSAENQFAIRRHWSDSLGFTHTHLEQKYKGVPVWTGEILVHLDANGKARPFDIHALIPAIDIDVVPLVTQEDALAISNAVLQPNGPYVVPPEATLVVLPITERVRRAGREQIPEESLNALDLETRIKGSVLAWHIHTELENGTEETAYQDFMIDAHSGKVINRWSTLQTGDSSGGGGIGCSGGGTVGVTHEGNATGTGRSQYSDAVPIATIWSCVDGDLDVTYALVDRTRATGSGNRTHNMDRLGRTDTVGVGGDLRLRGTLYVDRQDPFSVTDVADLWGDSLNISSSSPTASPNGQTAAVDAHFGLQVTWDLLSNVFGRRGLNDAGRPVLSRVHYGIAYNNAFWNSSCYCMTYGDGDGTLKSLTTPDVVGHELAHGLNESTAGLIYMNEAGGLNESNSDIFGTLSEFYLRGGGYAAHSATVPESAMGANFTMGEQLFDPSSSRRAIRWMDKPSTDGRSRDAWTADIIARTASSDFPSGGDPHYVSGPLNRWFYFLSEGVSSDLASRTHSTYLPAGMLGIGIHKAGQIWYRALITYLSPGANYADARDAALLAAGDLYGAGSTEQQATCRAFVAINVGTLSDC